MGDALKIQKVPSGFNKTRLIILDVNHVLCNIAFVRSKDAIPAHTYVDIQEDIQYEKPALIKASTRETYRLVTARPNVRVFLQKLSSMAHVGVWTCMAKDMAAPIVSWLFGECQPMFLLTQEYCTTLKHGEKNLMYRSEDALHEEFFKELPLFWKSQWHIDSSLFVSSSENTVIVDDSPLKCYLNPPNNCVHPHPWRSSNDPHSDILKDLKILLSLSQDVLSVPEFVDALFVDPEGCRSIGQDPISRNGRISKSLEPFTRFIRPSVPVLVRSG